MLSLRETLNCRLLRFVDLEYPVVAALDQGLVVRPWSERERDDEVDEGGGDDETNENTYQIIPIHVLVPFC